MYFEVQVLPGEKISKLLKENEIYIALAHLSMLLCLCIYGPAALGTKSGMGELRRVWQTAMVA